MGSRLGLNRLKRRSVLAQHQKAATIGSSSELEALRRVTQADSSSGLDVKKSNVDEILGGELVVTVNACQVNGWPHL